MIIITMTIIIIIRTILCTTSAEAERMEISKVAVSYHDRCHPIPSTANMPKAIIQKW